MNRLFMPITNCLDVDIYSLYKYVAVRLVVCVCMTDREMSY